MLLLPFILIKELAAYTLSRLECDPSTTVSDCSRIVFDLVVSPVFQLFFINAVSAA